MADSSSLSPAHDFGWARSPSGFSQWMHFSWVVSVLYPQEGQVTRSEDMATAPWDPLSSEGPAGATLNCRGAPQ